MKYRKNKEKKKDEDSGKKYYYKTNKSNKVMDIAKELESALSKQTSKNEEKEETLIIKATVDLESNNPENNRVTLKSNRKKKALKKFEDN